MATANKHKYYEVLNLIGYGLSKFNKSFVETFGYKSKSSFYRYIVSLGIAETESVVKNRQDLFDGMSEGGVRKGWWQKGAVYKHRKDYIDSLFGNLNVKDFVDIVKLSLSETINNSSIAPQVSPITRSCYKQMQNTGLEAENYFMNNYTSIQSFSDSKLEDARLFGDGYDFQLIIQNHIYLVEVKGVKKISGQIRMTEKEYNKAIEYSDNYALAVVSNLIEIPKIAIIYNPTQKLTLTQQKISSIQTFYRTNEQIWK
jgi:hypothetical protein